MPQLKKLKGPSNAEITFNLKRDPLEFHFSVQSNEPIHHCPHDGKSIWQLWDYDVVEVFLQPRKNHDDFQLPYYEFQLSPGNKQFYLSIIEPRKIHFTPLNLSWEGETNETENGWEAFFRFQSLKLDSNDQLFFGAFAILGKGERSYFSFSPKDQIIDYHRPKYFLKSTII